MSIHNIGIHINFYQNQFINENVRKNFLKFSYRRKDIKTKFFLGDVEELTFLIKYLLIHDNSFHINFYKNQFINEWAMKNFLKFQERQMTFCDLQWPLRSYLLKWNICVFNISIHINFYQNRFINECVRKNFLKIS